MVGDPKDYQDINDWAKTITKEDAEKIYHELNAGFNKVAERKLFEKIRPEAEKKSEKKQK